MGDAGGPGYRQGRWTTGEPGAARPGIVPLRPLGLGELLDGSLSLIRAHPRLVLGPAALVAVVSELLQLPVRYSVGGSFAALARPGVAPPSLETLGQAVAGGVAVSGVGGLIQVLTTTVLTGLLMVVLGRAVLGAPVDAADCWRAARSRLPGLLGVVVILTLVGLAVVAVCAVPAVVVYVAGGPAVAVAPLGVLGFLAAVAGLLATSTLLSLAAPAYVLEGVGVLEALRRSRTLVRGRFWPVLGILLLAGLIVAVVGGIIGVPFGLVGGLSAAGSGEANPFALLPLTVQAVGTVIALTVTMPFQAGVTGLLYVDQRMRREGFDIALQRAAAPGPPGVA